MKKWEYLKVPFNNAPEPVEYDGRTFGSHPSMDDLKLVGQKGWELVCHLPKWGQDSPALLFKREIIPRVKRNLK